MYYDETPDKVSVSSISCTLPNKSEDDVLQRETITQKNQTQEITTKYVLPHRRKIEKIKVPRKQEAKLTTPPIHMKDKLQHYKFYGVEDHAIKNE